MMLIGLLFVGLLCAGEWFFFLVLTALPDGWAMGQGPPSR